MKGVPLYDPRNPYNANTEALKAKIESAGLADIAAGWRINVAKVIGADFSQEEAAYFLGIPPETYRDIEDGNGFSYGLLLVQAMLHLIEDWRRIGGYTTAQQRHAARETAKNERATSQRRRKH